MVHFTFSDNDQRYLFLKYDTENDYKILKKLQKAINLVDPICYLPTYTGIPFTQDFLFEYRQKNGNTLFYSAIGLWSSIWKWFKQNNVEFDGLDSSRFKYPIKQDVFGIFKCLLQLRQIN